MYNKIQLTELVKEIIFLIVFGKKRRWKDAWLDLF